MIPNLIHLEQSALIPLWQYRTPTPPTPSILTPALVLRTPGVSFDRFDGLQSYDLGMLMGKTENTT